MDFYNMCRVCLCEADAISKRHYIFDGLNPTTTSIKSDRDRENSSRSNMNIAEVLTLLTNLDIQPQDNFPQTICELCFSSIKMFYEFRQKCIKGADRLKDQLSAVVFMREEEERDNEDDLWTIDEGGDSESVDNIKQEVNDSNCSPYGEFIVEIIDPSIELTPIKLETDRLEMYSDEGNVCDLYGIRDEDDDSNRNVTSQFICKTCDSKFTVKSSYDRHMRTFHAVDVNSAKEWRNYEEFEMDRTDRGYSCRICKKNFRGKSNYVCHVRNCKSFANSRNYCSICDKTLSKKSTFDYHMKVHNGTAETIVCDVCGKQFYRRESLKDHMNIHTNNRPYVCQLCGATFRQYCSFDMHKQLHDGKKYKCDECNVGFVTKALLADHNIIVHEGIRRFKCDVCGNSYFRRSHLQSHRKIHQPKQFRCDICSTDFTRFETLQNHKYIHTGKPFTCSLCKKGFVKRYRLRAHLKDNHNLKEPLDNLINEMRISTKLL